MAGARLHPQPLSTSRCTPAKCSRAPRWRPDRPFRGCAHRLVRPVTVPAKPAADPRGGRGWCGGRRGERIGSGSLGAPRQDIGRESCGHAPALCRPSIRVGARSRARRRGGIAIRETGIGLRPADGPRTARTGKAKSHRAASRALRTHIDLNPAGGSQLDEPGRTWSRCLSQAPTL